MFTRSGTYKHRNFLDVVMRVNRVYQTKPGVYSLKVAWYCQGLFLGDDKVVVSHPKPGDWERVQ